MASPTTTCPSCGTPASGSFCSACGAALGARVCAQCEAPLSPAARFCHRCGRPALGGKAARSERTAWLVAAVLVIVLVGGIVWQLLSDRPQPTVPDMANPGAASGGLPAGPAPDISNMSPRERFDRLFNRVMAAAESGDSATVVNFTPMALGAYAQLDSVNVDARYHAAVLRLQVGDLAPAEALADTILRESPGHLFAYVVRGEAAAIRGDTAALRRARQDFLANYDRELGAKRVEYLEHKPVLDDFARRAGRQ